MFSQLRASYRRFRNRQIWDRVWRSPGERPGWMINAPRPFVLNGFADGWLVPGMTVLEIGCGRGNTAIWLAERGVKVLGVDVSETAIRQARDTFPRQAGLDFEVMDICGDPPFAGTFDVILDTGCLQHFSPDLQAPYRKNLLRASYLNTRFVVTMHLQHRKYNTLEARREEVLSLLTPPFELVHTEQVKPGDARMRDRLNPVFHLIRR